MNTYKKFSAKWQELIHDVFVSNYGIVFHHKSRSYEPVYLPDQLQKKFFSNINSAKAYLEEVYVEFAFATEHNNTYMGKACWQMLADESLTSEYGTIVKKIDGYLANEYHYRNVTDAKRSLGVRKTHAHAFEKLSAMVWEDSDNGSYLINERVGVIFKTDYGFLATSLIYKIKNPETRFMSLNDAQYEAMYLYWQQSTGPFLNNLGWCLQPDGKLMHRVYGVLVEGEGHTWTGINRAGKTILQSCKSVEEAALFMENANHPPGSLKSIRRFFANIIKLFKANMEMNEGGKKQAPEQI
jgi:hypothetical protein